MRNPDNSVEKGKDSNERILWAVYTMIFLFICTSSTWLLLVKANNFVAGVVLFIICGGLGYSHFKGPIVFGRENAANNTGNPDTFNLWVALWAEAFIFGVLAAYCMAVFVDYIGIKSHSVQGLVAAAILYLGIKFFSRVETKLEGIVCDNIRASKN